MPPTPVRVLLVDDEPSILGSASALLREFGYDVVTHADARTIAEAVARERPDVLLQDVRMPGLDVAALVAALRADARARSTRIVLFSADLGARDVAHQLGLPLVRRPFKPEELLAALRG